MKQKTKTTAVQLVKYGLVGVSNSLITLAVIFVCNELLGLKLMLADVIGYIAGVINSFIWNIKEKTSILCQLCPSLQ